MKFALTGDEETFKKNIALVDNEIEGLKQQRLRLEKRLEQCKRFEFDRDAVKQACERVRRNLKSLSFDDKRLALSALGIEVTVCRDSVTLRGAIPIESIVSTPS